MQGVLGLLLLALGALFVYDVFAGKSFTMLSLLNGQSESAKSSDKVGAAPLPLQPQTQPSQSTLPQQGSNTPTGL